LYKVKIRAMLRVKARAHLNGSYFKGETSRKEDFCLHRGKKEK